MLIEGFLMQIEYIYCRSVTETKSWPWEELKRDMENDFLNDI